MNISWSDDCSDTIGGIEFSHKEICVMALMINGKSYKEMADVFDVSDNTVAYHAKNIMRKTASSSKREIANFVVSSDATDTLNDCFYRLTRELPRFLRKRNAFQKNKLIYILLLSLLVVIPCFLYFHVSFRASNVFTQSENYLDRYNFVSRIEQTLSKQNKIKIAVIIGVGGSGKTTIARQFLQTVRSDISWEINAETDHSTFASFVELAEAIAKTKDQKNDIEVIKSITNNYEKRRRLVNFVALILRDCRSWCLLFDNVEDFSTILEYFPKNENIWGTGTVLLTTRNKNICHSSHIKQGTDITIENLSSGEQYMLFCKILFGENQQKISAQQSKEIAEFLTKIPPMPLDISAAAYYLKNTNSSFEDYIIITEKTREDFEKIQGKLLEESINYSKTRYGIITSTFEEVIKQNEKFKELLLFVCLLDSQGIPKKFLKDVGDSVLVDNFIYNLRKHSLITYDDDKISIHRSTQNMGLSYLTEAISACAASTIKKMVSKITPYKYLDENYNDIVKFIPHLKAFLSKITRAFGADSSLDGCKIDLLLAIGDIYRLKECRAAESIAYFDKALAINKSCNHLDAISEAIVNIKIGKVYTSMSRNEDAMKHLSLASVTLASVTLDPKMASPPADGCTISNAETASAKVDASGAATTSAKVNASGATTVTLVWHAIAHRLIGVIKMRSNLFDDANSYFAKAISILDQAQDDTVEVRIARANAYSDMAFNYFMNGINRRNANEAVAIMKKAIDVLTKNAKSDEKTTSHLIGYKTRLSGIYNALGKYDLSLNEGKEAEDLLKTLASMDNNAFCNHGIILRERGLSHLRLNKVKEAYDYFMQAKEIFSKAMVFDYLFRLKMHEAEALIRMDRLDEAFKACGEIFVIKNRERNNYCDLFFNTCYYHAAVIKHRQGDAKAASEYFKQFFSFMKELCRKIVPNAEYNELIKQNAFDGNDIKTYFENSLKVFEAIYWKDYEFTKYYVEECLPT